uniref:Uncharacterized protein n=1 Tax=Rhizophora mucronata TaxID=61149 RepID=A0A2P2QYF4_RHIMU
MSVLFISLSNLTSILVRFTCLYAFTDEWIVGCAFVVYFIFL